MNENDDYSKETFLDKIYQDLHMSDEVMHTATPSDKKEEKIRKYLERLEKIENKASENRYHDYDKLKELFHKKYVIKPENIPESYYELQKRLMLERGYGHVDLDQLTKDEMAETIINDQKKSLDTWLDYLIKNDAKYPEWFKYYAFQGMVRLGTYSKETGRFGKRSETTTQIFADLNREALALVYDNITNFLDKQEIEEKDLQKLLESGSFSKLYAYFLQKLENSKKELNNPEDGVWIKYQRGSEPDELVNSIEGKGTGWCTAGYETARSQLRGGDFYVYYTKDSDGNYKQPRLAIRMEGNQIGEIRGIAQNQNIEPEMEKIVNQKLEEFPDRDRYQKKVRDMEKLTKIYNEYNMRNLTDEELRFLYEIDNQIDGFGYEKDPRIEEIKSKRNWKEDLAKIFQCSIDEISNNKQDVLTGKKIIYFYGDLNLGTIQNKRLKTLYLPEYVSGTLRISMLKSAKDITFPKRVGGSLSLDNLTYEENLILPEYIGKDLNMWNLISAKRITWPKTIGGSLNLMSLTSQEGLILPQRLKSLILGLKSIEGLIFPQVMDGYLDLSGVESAKDVILPQSVNGEVYLSRLKYAENVVFPKTISQGILDKDGLRIDSLISLEGIIIPKNFDYWKVTSPYFTKEDLVNKSLEQETEINYKRKGFSNIPLLIFASYITSLILVFLILSILK